MSGIWVIPKELIDPKKLEEFLSWVKGLPVDLMTKKYILIAWCEETKVKLTADLIAEVCYGYKGELSG